MKKIILTSILSVLITIIILGGIFIFWQNRDNSVDEDSGVRENIEQSKKDQDKEFDNIKTVFDEVKSIEDNQNIQNNNEQKQEKQVSIVIEGDRNYVIYTDENGKKLMVDEALMRTEAHPSRENFNNARFSPQKNYIIYDVVGHDIGQERVYDIDNSKRLGSSDIIENQNIIFVQSMNFTPDEKYLFSCGVVYPGFAHAKVYKIPEEEVVLDVFGGGCDGVGEGCENIYGTKFYNGYKLSGCYYNKKNNVIEFNIKKEEVDEFNSPTGKMLDEKTIEFKLE